MSQYEALAHLGKRPLAAPHSDKFCYIRVMNLRARKAIGTLLTVIWVITYCLIVGAVGAIMVIGRGMALELPFYVIAGFGWLPVEMLIIKWMSKPDAPH